MSGLYEKHKKEMLSNYRGIYGPQASERDSQIHRFGYYYNSIYRVLDFLVERNSRVLCVRSDIGQYLACVEPSRGVGIENTPELIEISRRQYPEYDFVLADFDDIPVEGEFDYVLIINGVNDFFDVQQVLACVRSLCNTETRIILIYYNFLWQPLVWLSGKLGMKREQTIQNWLSPDNLRNMFLLEGYSVTREYRHLLMPLGIPLVSTLLNKFAATVPLVEKLCFLQATVARTRDSSEQARGKEYSVSVIVPCKDEKGNVESAVERIPQMGSHTEIIFCDDKSTDGTAEEVQRLQKSYPHKDIKLVQGPGICKAENVWTGFESARGDILIILDGDLAVPPEELPKFYEPLSSGKAEFINGTRLVYPMRNQSMRIANVLGNKFFSLLFSHILRQNVSDTLCGTKALFRKDYLRLKKFRNSWGVNDRWGDYELIFGAARLSLEMLEVPVHYMEREYGKTKMTNRLSNAWRMFRVAMTAYSRLRGLPRKHRRKK